MEVYIFNAALLCEGCGAATYDDLESQNIEDTGDSDDFPQGPYSDGGGESDSPQHCDNCHVFLENPLTDEGYKYVTEAVMAHSKGGNGEVIRAWVNFYDIRIDSEESEESD